MNWHASGQILFFIFPAFPSVVQADCALTSLKNLKEFSETSCERSENYLRALPQSQTFHGLMRLSSRGQKMLQGCFLQISSPGATGHNPKTVLLVRVFHNKQTNKKYKSTDSLSFLWICQQICHLLLHIILYQITFSKTEHLLWA